MRTMARASSISFTRTFDSPTCAIFPSPRSRTGVADAVRERHRRELVEIDAVAPERLQARFACRTQVRRPRIERPRAVRALEPPPSSR